MRGCSICIVIVLGSDLTSKGSKNKHPFLLMEADVLY